jgi:hypothetical protein
MWPDVFNQTDIAFLQQRLGVTTFEEAQAHPRFDEVLDTLVQRYDDAAARQFREADALAVDALERRWRR